MIMGTHDKCSMQASDRYGSVSHKSLAKFVMLFGVVFFLLYSNYRKESVQCIAKVSETLEKTRSVSMLCSPAYKAEIQALDPVCLPARCGRMISDDIVTEAEAHALLNLAKKGLAQGKDQEIDVYCSVYDMSTRSDALLFNITPQAIIFNPGGGAGGASILDLHSGALSKEKLFINLYKTNPGLFTERDFDLYRLLCLSFVTFHIFFVPQ